MTILVTGGAGYIGSHTVRHLRDHGLDVVVLDNLELSDQTSLLGAPFVRGEITDRHLVTSLCRDFGVTQAVHFAAYKNVGESMRDPGRYWRNNVAGTVELVEALLASGVTDLVFSSSCSVHGTPATVPVTEDHPVRPESVYAQTKATVETILGWYTQTSGLAAVNLRYFNAAGAAGDGAIGENWEHSQNLIPLVMKAALGVTGELQVFGDDYPTPDGTCIRDYVHVEDLADAHHRALTHLAAQRTVTAPSSAPGTVTLNIGTGTGTSVLEIIALTEQITGRPVPYRVVPRRPGDPAAVWADPRKAAETLGWRARRSIGDILTSAWNWHQRTNTTPQAPS